MLRQGVRHGEMVGSGGASGPSMLPPVWYQSFVSGELRGMAREIVAQIRDAIPAYRRSLDGPLTLQTRRAVEGALQQFLREVGGAHTRGPQHDEMFRALGRTEAQAGRGLDCLLSAYRIGSMTAWRHVLAVNDRMPLPADTLGQLAAGVLRYVDDLSKLSEEGYHQAMLGRSEHVDRLQARLLQMLLDQPATPVEAVHELADQIGWVVPQQVAVIDLRDGEKLDASVREMFGSAALVGVEHPPPTVLLPAPLDEGTIERWRRTIGGASLAVGCVVPLAQARQSLQWAQSAARLQGSSALPPAQVTVCEDVLPDLLLASSPLAVDLLVARQLGPLQELTPSKRYKYGRLLSAWLERGGSQADIADVVGLHRQTVHYQFTRLQELLGPRLRDPQARVEMLLALRSVLPQWEREAGTAAD